MLGQTSSSQSLMYLKKILKQALNQLSTALLVLKQMQMSYTHELVPLLNRLLPSHQLLVCKALLRFELALSYNDVARSQRQVIVHLFPPSCELIVVYQSE